MRTGYMQAPSVLVAFFALLLASVAGCSADDPGPPLALGFAKRDIAPSAAQIAKDKIYMGAYGIPLTRHASGVHDSTFARVMAVQSRQEALLLVVLDAPVLSQHLIRDASAALSAALAIPASRVLVGATHTHSAPDLMGLWGGVPDEYRGQVLEGIVAAGKEAWQSRVPATLEVRQGKADNRNRRGWDHTDKDLMVLHGVDLQGNSLGALLNFAAHPIFLGIENTAVSRDFCGYLVDAVERDLGAPALYFNGIVGDVSPIFGAGKDGYEKAQGYGEAMAKIASGLLEEAPAARIEEGLYATEARWTQLVDNAYFTLAELGGLLDEFDVDKSGGVLKIDIEASYFRLGESLSGVTFPGEALTRTGLAIKDELRTPHRLFLGLTRATLGYFIRQDEWKIGRNDDYEETVSPGPDAGETAIEAITKLIAADPLTSKPAGEAHP